MKALLLGLLLLGCQRTLEPNLSKGDCVLGDETAVWKLMRISDDGEYLLARMPAYEGTPVEIVRDVRTFKKVECPY
jgi:hypothetical protein